MENVQTDPALLSRLEETGPIIEKLREICGNAGISLGVLHEGKVIYRANYGYRDVEAKLEPRSDTVFPIASMTKALVALAFAKLVEDGKIEWDTRLSDLVPEYGCLTDEIKCPELVTDANIVDLLAHRLGLTAGNNFWSQKNPQVLIGKTETARLLGSLEPLAPFREKFIYSNWGYGLAGEILETVTGMSLEEYFQKYLFHPLGMSHSTMAKPDSKHYAKAYMAMSNATPWEISPTAYEAGNARAGAGACKSSVDDLLVLYSAWLAAAADQEEHQTTKTPGSPFCRVTDTWTPQIKLNGETSYGLGWGLNQLPAKLGLLGVNGLECPELPVVGRGTKPQRLVYHQGSVCGALSAVYLLPKTHSAIVVLSNSFDLSDTPDWISQLLIEALLDAPEKNDFVELAQQTSANALSHHPLTSEKLATDKENGTTPRPLQEYCGKFYNSLGNFFLEISLHDDGLCMSPQGFQNTSYILQHYHNDVFAWPCDRDAESKEGIYPQFSIGFHLVSFFSGPDGRITTCNWQVDKAIPDGQTFTRR